MFCDRKVKLQLFWRELVWSTKLSATTSKGSFAITSHHQRHAIVNWLQSQTDQLLREIESQEFWSVLMSPGTSPQYLHFIMSEVYADITDYQPHVIEAAIAAIAQMPRSMNPRLIKSMLVHQAEEFDHGEMALRDLLGLGGSEDEIRSKRMSPEAFAVAGIWQMIVHTRDPFAYLGALFLFEGLTPKVTGLVIGRLQEKGFTPSSLEYVQFHSTEDVKHANLVHYLISEIANAYPESLGSMKYGFNAFRAVYPIPLWKGTFRRATERFRQYAATAK